MDFSIEYYDQKTHSKEVYFDFLKECYGEKLAEEKIGSRSLWFGKCAGYVRLLAVKDNKIIGHSCAFSTIALVEGLEKVIWWGIDAYVLPSMQGKGIGKLLQKRLHEDLPNFSSAWYSPTNGIVKKKCGTHVLFTTKFCYYPVSSIFNELGEKAFRKLFHRSYPKIRLPFFYGVINRRSTDGYDVREVELSEDMCGFIEKSLKPFDFYVIRSWQYLRWRYIENPNLRYHLLEIIRNNRREALLFFSDVHHAKGLRIVYHMDQFICANSTVDTRFMLSVICDYYKSKGCAIDGIKSLSDTEWIGKIQKPRKGLWFLSTLNAKNINRPYLTYSDQDMVEM